MTDEELVRDWTETLREHWERCDGLVGTDHKFWEDCLHKVSVDTYQAILNVCAGKIAGKPWYAKKYPFLYDDMRVIDSRVLTYEPVTKRNNPNQYNRQVYRGLMAFKDMIGEETGRPFPQHGAPAPVVKKRRPTRDEILAQADKLSVMVKDLFN
jgi:hypothetical protein